MPRAGLGVVALVGRANVGKSALFNHLTKTRSALVVDQPGVTRDRQYGYATLASRRCVVIDTGGLAGDNADIDAMASIQVDTALAEADVVVFVVDARTGLTTDDEVIADRLRRRHIGIVLVVNKAEGLQPSAATAEFYALGLGEPLAISAVHGDRLRVFTEQIAALLPPPAANATARTFDDGIQLTVVGRPNVGKSSLINRLLGSERMLTQDEPGTTRDAVRTPFERGEQRYTLIDTAGIRRRSKSADKVEHLGAVKAMQAIDAAEIVLVVLDAADGLTHQDVRLLGLTVERGRAAVIVVNKWDRLDARARQAIHRELVDRLTSFSFLPLCFISAQTGYGIDIMFDAIHAGYKAAAADLSTAQLTRVLEEATIEHAPPLINGRRIKLRYAHQGGRKPPTIVVHGNQTGAVPAVYTRYLCRRFREAFDLFGTPITIIYRTGDNPYASRR